MSGEFGDEGGKEIRGGGAGGGELGFQLVDQGHQLIHFGDDPALFHEGGDGNPNLFKDSKVDVLLGRCRSELLEVFLRSAHEIFKVAH